MKRNRDDTPRLMAWKIRIGMRGGIKGILFTLLTRVSILFTVCMFIVIFTPISNYLASALTVPMEIKKVELTAVLGGGAYSNAVLSASSSERLLHGLRLHNQGLSDNIVFIGGVFKEGALMKSVAEDIGVSPEEILLDIESKNTYENIRALKAIMERMDFDTCMIVTGPTHMLRAIKIARKLSLNCTPAPVGDYTLFVDDPIGRLLLMRSVIREYAALFIYKIFRYI